MHATPVRTVRKDPHQVLYRLDPPATWGDDYTTVHVVVSAVHAPYSGPETYVFPADPDGAILDWAELEGSYRGGLDHAEALQGAGYEVTA